MSHKSLSIAVAGIRFLFPDLVIETYGYLSQKYQDFLIPDTSSGEIYYNPQDVVVIALAPYRPIRAVMEKKRNAYIVPVMPINKHFSYFNGLFRGICSFELAKRNGILLHGSVLVYEGKAYVFIGKQGAGKSTVRRLYSTLVCLGDDSALARQIKGKYYIYGSPFYQRTKRLYPNLKVVLGGIFSLCQFSYNRVNTLNYSEKFKILSENVFTYNVVGKNKEDAVLAQSLMQWSAYERIFILYFQKKANFFSLLLRSRELIRLHKRTQWILNPYRTFFRDVSEASVVWRAGISDPEILLDLYVIREPSWQFEMHGERSLEHINRMIFMQDINTMHSRKIRDFANKPLRTLLRRPIIMLSKPGQRHMSILDGNHRACALFEKYRLNIAIPPIWYIDGQTRDNLYWL